MSDSTRVSPSITEEKLKVLLHDKIPKTSAFSRSWRPPSRIMPTYQVSPFYLHASICTRPAKHSTILLHASYDASLSQIIFRSFLKAGYDGGGGGGYDNRGGGGGGYQGGGGGYGGDRY
jgi:uncharacterized membrane protein YgcG